MKPNRFPFQRNPTRILFDHVAVDYLLLREERAVMVANDGAVLGILTVTDVQRVPRDEWQLRPDGRREPGRSKDRWI